MGLVKLHMINKYGSNTLYTSVYSIFNYTKYLFYQFLHKGTNFAKWIFSCYKVELIWRLQYLISFHKPDNSRPYRRGKSFDKVINCYFLGHRPVYNVFTDSPPTSQIVKSTS